MAEFRCITQMDDNASFAGPTSTRYSSRKGDWFTVVASQDITHFSNFPKRFERKGMLTSIAHVVSPPKPVLKESAEVTLAKWAESLVGITKVDSLILAGSYNDKEEIISDLEQGFDIRGDLSQKKKNIIRKALGLDVDGGKIEKNGG